VSEASLAPSSSSPAELTRESCCLVAAGEPVVPTVGKDRSIKVIRCFREKIRCSAAAASLAKLLNLQAVLHKNPGRSGFVLPNPLFLPLFPADSVRLPFASLRVSPGRPALESVHESAVLGASSEVELPNHLDC
jgi:hypothetical protein